MANKKTISFSVHESDYEEIRHYAMAKGHGGQFPASTFAHYAVFQMMKKYPLSKAELEKIEGKHYVAGICRKAVQQNNAESNK